MKQGGGSIEDGATGTAGAGSSKSVALTTTITDGLTIGAGMGTVGTADNGVDADQETIFVTYAIGSVTLGYHHSEEDTSNANNWDSDQWGISFNVSDNLSVAYGERTVDIAETTADQEDTGLSASYTMGSMTIAGNVNTSDDQNGTTSSDVETTEIAVSFAF